MTGAALRSPSGDDAARRAGVAAVVAIAVCVGAAAGLLEREPAVSVGASTFWLGCLAVVCVAGLVVAWARPRNLIGWLLLTSVMLQLISMLAAAYAQVEHATGGSAPGVLIAAWIGSWTWFPSLALPIAVLPAIYPTGRPETRWQRLLAETGVVGIVAMMVLLGLSPDAAGDIVPGLRLPLAPPAWVGYPVVLVAAVGLAVSIVGGLSDAVLRTFRAPSPQRQQLLCLIAPMGAYLAGYFFSVPGGGLSYASVGVAVAVGVLRYGLLDITVGLRRTLLYAPLIALVAITLAGVSTVLARVTPDGPLPLVAAATAVAVLIGPVSGRLRRRVDRFVLGPLADPVSALSGITSRGGSTGSQDPLASLLGAIVDVVGVPYAAVVGRTGALAAAVGEQPGRTIQLPLRAGQELLGYLVVAEPHDAAGLQLLPALVPHLATVLRAERLSAELDTERSRAREAGRAERERIRQDLHDGLGPSLSGISLSLQAVDRAMTGEQAVARQMLRRARVEADSAVHEVRRVLDALGPVALDRLDLTDAIGSLALRLGLDGEHGPGFCCTSREVAAPVPPAVAEVAYRITGEALHNVVRHAHASRCAVRLATGEQALDVLISDDGVGLGDPVHPGVGLDSMRRRAEAMGGTFDLGSPLVAGGTVVHVRLPLGTQA